VIVELQNDRIAKRRSHDERRISRLDESIQNSLPYHFANGQIIETVTLRCNHCHHDVCRLSINGRVVSNGDNTVLFACAATCWRCAHKNWAIGEMDDHLRVVKQDLWTTTPSSTAARWCKRFWWPLDTAQTALYAMIIGVLLTLFGPP
jgi:hypothetical protein